MNDREDGEMGNNFRLEYSYFFQSGQEESLRDYLDTFPGLSRISFYNPVTQTLYFTQGRAGKYSVPERKIIRIRKYSDDKFVFVLGDELVHLEIKTSCDDWNSKERIIISGNEALGILSKILECSHISEKILDMPPMFPTVGTSTTRNHWVHQSGLRVTLDDEIAFFTFEDETGIGLFSEMCKEGKIEFKFPKSNDQGIEVIVSDILAGLTSCFKRDTDYLERRLRQCFFRKLNH